MILVTMLVSLNPLKEKVTDSLHDAKCGILEAIGQIADFYVGRPKVRAGTHALLLLAGIFCFDSLFGHLLAMRMIYIAPIWFAAQRGGRKVGFLIVLVTTILLTKLDHTILVREGSLFLQFMLRLSIMTALMLLIESQETRLKNYVDLASTDPLTGVGNRLALQRFAARAIERTSRTKDPITFVVIDCDNFKTLNDRFGHAYGDHVLKSLARLLRRGIGPTSMVARLGGDEFVAVVPGRRPEDVSRLLRRASERFETATSILDATPSFSYGVSVAWSGSEQLEDLIERADRDMYVRKASKRGQALVSTDYQSIAS